jgi:hypothetical protein
MGSKGLVKGGLKFGGGISSTTSISTLSLSSNLNKFLSNSIGSTSSIMDNNLHLTSGGSSSLEEKFHIVYMTSEVFGQPHVNKCVIKMNKNQPTTE